MGENVTTIVMSLFLTSVEWIAVVYSWLTGIYSPEGSLPTKLHSLQVNHGPATPSIAP